MKIILTLIIAFLNVIADKVPSYDVLPYNEDIIGKIEINNTTYPLVQALDNNYYLSHNEKRREQINGIPFLDYEGDLLNKKVNYIYNFNINLSKDTLININYLDNNYTYKVIKTSVNKPILNNNSYLVIKSNNKYIISILT